MSSAVRGAGAQLQREVSEGSGTWVTIAEVRSIDGPNASAEEIEVTNLDSTAKEFIGGLTDFGQLTFPMNWFYHATQSQLAADQITGLERAYRIRFPQFTPARLETFRAYVRDIGKSTAPNDAHQANVVLRITGVVTSTTE